MNSRKGGPFTRLQHVHGLLTRPDFLFLTSSYHQCSLRDVSLLVGDESTHRRVGSPGRVPRRSSEGSRPTVHPHTGPESGVLR